MDADRADNPPTGWDILGQTPGLLQVGDIVQTQDRSLLSRLVRWFTWRRGEGRSWASHSALVLTDDPAVIIIEAVLQVGVHPLGAYHRKGSRVVVHRRPGGLSETERRGVCLKALDYEGRWYGWFKVVLQAMDHAIGDRYVFRRLAVMDDYPICSWLVAYVYDRVLGVKFGLEPNAAAPNDILEYCVAQGWKLVWADSPDTVAECGQVVQTHRAAREKRQCRSD